MKPMRWSFYVAVSLLTILSLLLQPVAAAIALPVRTLVTEQSSGMSAKAIGDLAPTLPAASEAPAASMSISYTVHLPVVMRNYDPALVKAIVTAATGGVLKSADGAWVQIPAGALNADGYVTYSPSHSAIVGAPQHRFELRAYTNSGTELTQFTQPITGRIPYDYRDFIGADEASLTVKYFDVSSASWQPLPSQVDHHRFQVVFTTTHFSQFAVFAQPYAAQDECDDAQVGRGAPENIRSAMCTAFRQAGGPAVVGHAESDWHGDVHEWGSAWVQDFTGGTMWAPILLYRPDAGVAFYMDRNFVMAYADQASGPDGFLGLPQSNPRPDGPAWYKDDNNDFRTGPINYFDYGFIAYDQVSGAYEAHRYFPRIKKATWETFWIDTGTFDPSGYRQYQFKVRGTVDEAEANPFSKPGDYPLLFSGFWARTGDGTNGGQLSLGVGDAGEFTFPQMFTRTEKYQYYFFVWRPDPDNLSGYYPCNHGYADPADKGWFNAWASRSAHYQVTYQLDCTAGGGGGGIYDAPPQVSIENTWQSGQGGLAITAQATDDVGIARVELQSSDSRVLNTVMQASGNNLYDGALIDVPPSKQAHFTVTAYDSAGQSATVDQDNRVIYSSGFGSSCPGQCEAGNPVNTATGNDTDAYVDLVVPGRGSTDIIIRRNTNSQDERVGPFGLHSSFDYDLALQFVNNILLNGIQVRYGDGHTANFSNVGGGRYDPVSPGNFDFLTEESGEYVLHLKDRTTYRFNGDGRLTAVVNKNGHAITLAYDGAGELATMTNASGRTVEFDWTDGRITEVRAAEGKRLQYIYEADRLRYFKDADSFTTEYQYDGAGYVVAIITPNGYPHSRQAFDDRGRVIWQIVGTDERRDFQYDDASRATSVTDAYQHSITYTYNNQYLISSVQDARGNASHSTYDERGNLRSVTDRRGATWQYDYDERGNRILQIDPVDGDSAAIYTSDVTTWAYNESSDVISMTNALGNTTRFDYDAQGNLLHTYLPDSSVVTMTYDLYGQPLTVADGRGNITVNTYDLATGDLITVTDAENHSTGFGYDALGRQTVITDANGHAVHMTYDGRDNVTHVVDAKAQDTRFVYDGNGNLTNTYDRAGGHTQQIFDSSDRLVTTIDPVLARTEYGYNLMGYQTVMTNPRGLTATLEYDANYNVIAQRDPSGQVWRFEYDANNNKTAAIDPKQQRTRYVYDALNRVKYVFDSLYQMTEYCYNALDQLVDTFDPRRAETRFFYDPAGRLAHTVNAEGNPYWWIYDAAGNVISEINGENEVAQYGYDRVNRRVTFMNPLSQTITTTYNAVGAPAQVIDARGNPTWFGYDENNNLTVVTNTLGYTVTYTYDPEDRRTGVSDPESSLTQFKYYLDGQLEQMIEPGGSTTRYLYDPNKNVQQTINARGLTTTYTYDARDLPLAVTDPLTHTTSYTYDELARLVAKTDAEQKTYRYDYDPLGRLITVTDPITGVTAYRYDPVGNPITITYANGTTTTFQYNFINQPKMEVDALNNTHRYGYDHAGRLVQRVDGLWHATDYTYDSAGRLSATIFGSSGQRLDFEYDASGNPIGMRDWNGTLTREFDALNRPITVTDYLSHSLIYAWNPDGTRASLTYPDGRVLTYTYDADNRVSGVTLPQGQTAAYDYDPLGYLTGLSYSNGTQATYGYDDANRLTSLHTTGPGDAVIAWYDYVLDKVGNRRQTTEQRPLLPTAPVSTIERQYTYDDLYRLVQSTSSVSQTHDMNWAFDSVGNWTSRSGVPESTDVMTNSQPISTTYDHSPINSLVRAGDGLYQYDGNGNRQWGSTPLTTTQYAALTPTFGVSATLVTAYAYDYENRLTAVREAIQYPVTDVSDTWHMAISPTLNAHYVYDGLGRRVEKWVTTTVTSAEILTTPTVLRRQYVYDGLSVVAEYEVRDGEATSTTYLYHANDRLVAIEQVPVSGTAELLWYHYDGLGSVVALSDESGSITTTYCYDEYGNPLAGEFDLNRYTYTSQEWDAETGFYHFYARYYDAQNGVWLTQDIYRGNSADPLSLTRYLYVEANPVSKFDYLGFLTSEKYIEDIQYELQGPTLNIIRDLNNIRKQVGQQKAYIARLMLEIDRRFGVFGTGPVILLDEQMRQLERIEILTKNSADLLFYRLDGIGMTYDYKYTDPELSTGEWGDPKNITQICGVEVHRDFYANFSWGLWGRAAGYELIELQNMSNWGDALIEAKDDMVQGNVPEVSTIKDIVSGLTSWDNIGSHGQLSDLAIIEAGYKAYDNIKGKKEVSLEDLAPYIQELKNSGNPL